MPRPLGENLKPLYCTFILLCYLSDGSYLVFFWYCVHWLKTINDSPPTLLSSVLFSQLVRVDFQCKKINVDLCGVWQTEYRPSKTTVDRDLQSWSTMVFLGWHLVCHTLHRSKFLYCTPRESRILKLYFLPRLYFWNIYIQRTVAVDLLKKPS